MFLGKGALRICSKFTGEHPCRSVVSVKLQSISIMLQNLLNIFRIPFLKNTSSWLLLLITCLVIFKTVLQVAKADLIRLHYIALLSCRSSGSVAEWHGKLAIVSETSFIKNINLFHVTSAFLKVSAGKSKKIQSTLLLHNLSNLSEKHDSYTFSRFSYEEINWRKWESLTFSCDSFEFIIIITVYKIVGGE